MRSSTSSSSGDSAIAVRLTLAFIAGALAALVLVWSLDRTGIWNPLKIDPNIAIKWRTPLQTPRLYQHFLRPNVPTGEHYFRREGNRVEEGRILAAVTEERGIAQHPYGSDPPIRVSRGRYGFRDEYPPVPGGTALLGSSYVEAGFASAEDTLTGWLRRDHGVAASNFGIAYTGGYTALHYLDRFVLPTQPDDVVWIFAERSAFDKLVSEALAPTVPAREPRLPGLGEYVWRTATGFSESALTRARVRWTDALVHLGLRRGRRPVSKLPLAYHGTIELAGERIPIDSGVIRKPMMGPLMTALPQVLSRMKQACDAAGARLSIVYLPARINLLEGRWAERPPGLPDPKSLLPLLEAEAGRLAIPLRDARPALDSLLDADVLPLNPIFDQHLNAAGMRAVSAVIYDMIRAPIAGE